MTQNYLNFASSNNYDSLSLSLFLQKITNSLIFFKTGFQLV